MMKTVEVLTPDDKKSFTDFPKGLYRNDPFWICQLDTMVEAVFDPLKNHAFNHGDAKRWILKGDDGKLIGRIACFVDERRSAVNSQPTGGIGFFEVIEKREAAFALFDAARSWLASKGMEAMDGPINFGENDNNWGLLVEGFMQQAFGMPYNKSYYRIFFEEYGFKSYFEQYSYHREVRDAKHKIVRFPDRIMKIAEWISKRPGYSFCHFKFSEKKKFVNDIVEIYNSTWSVFKKDFTPLDPAFLDDSIQKAKAIIDEELIWFAYYNENPIAFFILFPDFNQILKHFEGDLNLWNILQLVYFKITHKMTRIRAVVGGIVPSHQNSGVESAIFLRIYEVFKKKPWFSELELSWVGDYNPKMISLYEALGARKTKTHITYRYMINDKLKFVRYKDELSMDQSINI
jgi:hypothetical protein